MTKSFRFSTASATAVAMSLALPAGAKASVDMTGVWWIKDRSEKAPVDHAKLPFTPEAAAQYEKNKSDLAAGKTVPTGQNKCVLEGQPRLMLSHLPFEILQRPEDVTFLFENNRNFRIVPIGATLPPNPEPSYNGTSVGAWDGDTLVVRTVALKFNTVLDATGIPHSDATHLKERFSLTNGGKTLRDEVTVDDTKAFTKPWSFTLEFVKKPGLEIMDDVCTDGAPMRDRAGKT